MIVPHLCRMSFNIGTTFPGLMTQSPEAAGCSQRPSSQILWVLVSRKTEEQEAAALSHTCACRQMTTGGCLRGLAWRKSLEVNANESCFLRAERNLREPPRQTCTEDSPCTCSGHCTPQHFSAVMATLTSWFIQPVRCSEKEIVRGGEKKKLFICLC